MALTVTAAAKLNLYLDITGLRSDGYHLLETVMQSVTLSDAVTLELCGGGITVACDNPLIPCGEGNIAYKAAAAYFDAAGADCGVDIRIQKRIPSGAGMGGGSADAAAVLAGLDRLLGSPVSRERLYEIAAEIGADVPFCLRGGTQVCKGIGEIMEEAPEVRDCFFLVVMPNFTCPTGEAYGRYDKSPISAKNGLSEFVKSVECGAFVHRMYNVFELLYDDSRIAGITERLVRAGAQGARLTGSGAAVFGVFGNEAGARSAAAQFPECFTAVCAPTSSNIVFS